MAQKGQKMAVTIKDVAKQAGVSTATVSKVMNGSYSISRETIDRVKKVMRHLPATCYTPLQDHLQVHRQCGA